MGLPACSIAFDTDPLRAGDGGGSADAAASSAASASTSTSATTTTTGSSGGAASSSGISASSGTTSEGGAGGGDGEGGAGTGGAGEMGGGGSGGCTGPTFCETDGADAVLCFDFDGVDPLEGLSTFEPDAPPETVSTITVVDEPSVSCPNALATRVEAAADYTFAMAGFDVPSEMGHFVWAFDVQREPSDVAGFMSVAILQWETAGTPCQAFVMLRDDDAGQGEAAYYSQYNDGMAWIGGDFLTASLPHPTAGSWSHVKLDADLVAGTILVQVEDEVFDGQLDTMCGVADDHVDVDVGINYSDQVQGLLFDNITLRLIE